MITDEVSGCGAKVLPRLVARKANPAPGSEAFMNSIDKLRLFFSQHVYREQLEASITISHPNYLTGLLRILKTRLFVASSVLALLLTYILYPSLPSLKDKNHNKMFSKRPDKHTTGLINMRNDCFANSSIQAYSALPGLTEYLNKFLDLYRRSIDAFQTLEIDLNKLVPSETVLAGSQSRFISKKSSDSPKTVEELFQIPLHIALAKIVSKLQETQLTSRTVSVWTFLHELERIYNAKISRSQHDAHELTQLINETLESESISCIKILRAIKEILGQSNPLPMILEEIEFPEFPFSGLMLSQMKCLNCSFNSKPSITPFLMLTLHPPQALTTDLDSLLNQNESETISEYHCLKCRLSKIVVNEEFRKTQGHLNSEEERKILEQIAAMNNDEHLFINEDLPQSIDNYVKNYKKDGIEVRDITTSVYRESHILKPPKVFGIHLSRSAFNGVTVSRNPCRVSFNDKLSLSIGKDYLEDLRKFQESANAEVVPQINSRVLTTDVNDMEDESNQREDVDEKGDEDEDNNILAGSDVGSLVLFSTDSTSTSSTSSSGETAPPDLTASGTLKAEHAPKNETLNSAPISQDQSQSLIKHFRKFKFDESNIYKYRLKAIIRHQGSHTQGHYECYRKKPLFVKDDDGNIIKLSPEIDENELNEIEKLEFEKRPVGSRDRTSSNSTSDLQDTIDGERKNFRRKLSIMMGRRPSVIQADPTAANLQEFIASGLATPAEVLVDSGDYFQMPGLELQERLDNVKNEEVKSSQTKVKMKKLSSVIKHPYWRVGDAQVSEVSSSAVMFETASVYMLYYERLDQKQLLRL